MRAKNNNLSLEQKDSAVVSHEPFVEVEGQRVRAPVEPKQTNCNQVEIGVDWHDYECKKKIMNRTERLRSREPHGTICGSRRQASPRACRTQTDKLQSS